MSYPTTKDKMIELYRKRLKENKDMEAKKEETKKEYDELSKLADKTDDHLKNGTKYRSICCRNIKIVPR